MKNKQTLIQALLILMSTSMLFGCVLDKNASNKETLDSSTSILPMLDDDNIPLETNIINDDQMYDIVNMAALNTITSVGGRYSLKDVNKISDVKQLRNCLDDKTIIYNVYITEKGRFYVFYGNCHSISNEMVIFCCYAEKLLRFSDFDEIKIGESTLEDIKSIDKTTESFDYGSQMVCEAVLSGDYSIHMTKEGLVVIGYKKVKDKLHVDYLYKIKNNLISGINPLDLPGTKQGQNRDGRLCENSK